MFDDMAGVTIIGALASDLIVSMNKIDVTLPEWQRASDYSFDPGGICTTALAVKRLGLPTSILGWAGRDLIGDRLISHLKDELIVVKGILRLKSSTTLVVALIDPLGNHNRIAVTSSGQLKSLPKFWQSTLDRPSFVFLNGFTCIELPNSLVYEIIDRLYRSQSTLVFDPQNVIDKIEERLLKHILSRTNTLTISDQDLQKLLPGKALTGDPLTELRRYGIKSLFVRQGANGVTTYSNGTVLSSPAFQVRPRNTLGAGDCFNGGILFGLAHDFDVSDTATLGNAIAAIKVSRRGTGSSVPSRTEIREFLLGHGFTDLTKRSARAKP